MRVACVNQDPGIDPSRRKGAAVHLDAIRRAFAERGDEVVALDETDDPTLVARLSRCEGIDLIYERYALGRDAAARFADAAGIPHLLEVNAPLAEEARLWRGDPRSEAVAARDRFTFGHATLVSAVSSDVARYAIELGAAPERVRVVPNAVDPDRFHPGRRAEQRASLAPPDRLVLGFFGRLRPWHGIELLIEATALSLSRGLPVHLLLVGEGPLGEAARSLPPEHVTCRGWLPHAEVGALVACMDVLPLTYSAERSCYFSPLKLSEAMAAGVVPIVPRLGDLPRAVEHGVDGLVVEPGQAEALVAAIENLWRDPGLRRRLRDGAIRRGQARSWRSALDSLLAEVPWAGEAAAG